MTLRAKILLAQLPLVLALVSSAIAGGLVAVALGRSSQQILRDNYRSVLAAQRMKESLERMDSSALFIVAGRPDLAARQASTNRARFEEELRTQEANLTEAGEREATRRLREAWETYWQKLEKLRTGADEAYFDEVLPAFVAVKDAADTILSLNQDAMVRKSDRALRLASDFRNVLILVSAAALLLGLFASATMTTRILRPVSVLSQAARRIGAGDLEARARIQGRDEIAQLAAEFNTMAERIQKYRESTLGELLEAQKVSQATIDSLQDPVLVLSLEGHVLHANRAAENILTISVEAGKTALTDVDPEVRALIERVCQHPAAGRSAFVPRGLDEAVRITTPAGDKYFIPRATSVEADEGHVVGTTIVLQDVSRVVRIEELRNNLVATVAHEFRTPLTSLRMAIHLLTEQAVGPLAEKQADLVYAAREDCERLQSIVDELLDLSRIQAGRMELRKDRIRADDLVKAALDAVRASAGQKHVGLASEVLPGLPEVMADAERVQIVFTNLLTNAIRHSPQSGTVTVRAAAARGTVRFEIIDAGPGIPGEYQQAIFEKYFQVPGAPTGGAGLGLFLAKEIVIAHGGEIGVETRPGQGSMFWFTLQPPSTESLKTRSSPAVRRARGGVA